MSQQNANNNNNNSTSAHCPFLAMGGDPTSMANPHLPPPVTSMNGSPIHDDPFATQRVGEHGPLLLQDSNLIESLAHFNRERIPERNPHAHGSGAFGYFQVTHDITDICSSQMFSTIGLKTDCLVRFSTVAGERGSADTVRDPRGFAIKFYTQEGNLDWVYNNTPIFFIRDPSKFPAFIHTQKRNPRTNLKDPNAVWDWFTTKENQVAIHQILQVFSDRGTPKSYRNMNGYSGHTYKWSSKKTNTWHYVQVHIKTDQGIQNMTNEEAVEMAGKNPDAVAQDLFDHIASGQFPSWTVYIQTMTHEQSLNLPFSVFDLTKVWPHAQFPLRPVGKLVLNRNPDNYFAQIEQAAFAPSNTVPYQEPSADPVLQARLFAYADAHRYRLGANYTQIPVNCPYSPVYNPLIRDGAMNVNGNLGSEPNYYATNVNYNLVKTTPQRQEETWQGPVIPYHWTTAPDDSDFVQATALYHVLGRQKNNQQEHLAHNIAVSLCGARRDIRERAYQMFERVHPSLAQMVKQETESLTNS